MLFKNKENDQQMYRLGEYVMNRTERSNQRLYISIADSRSVDIPTPPLYFNLPHQIMPQIYLTEGLGQGPMVPCTPPPSPTLASNASRFPFGRATVRPQFLTLNDPNLPFGVRRPPFCNRVEFEARWDGPTAYIREEDILEIYYETLFHGPVWRVDAPAYIFPPDSQIGMRVIFKDYHSEDISYFLAECRWVDTAYSYFMVVAYNRNQVSIPYDDPIWPAFILESPIPAFYNRHLTSSENV